MSHLIGIDLGTTNSCVATYENNNVIIIPSKEGGRTTPSVVSFNKFGERLVGKAAKNQMLANPKTTICSIKRHMGTNYTIKIEDKKYTPQEISAMILRKLKEDAESFLGEEVTDAVITVPAYFSDAARQATKDAGKIAGLNVVRIINEPTAAALAYGLDKAEPQKIMVFDFGGGTLDVSILDINNGVIEVLATSGNNLLGGDDFDNAVINYLLEKIKNEYKVDLKKDINALTRIKEASEKAKIELSSTQNTIIDLPFLCTYKGEPINFSYTLSREKFNEITKDILIKIDEPINQAIKDSHLKFSDLKKVIMVGGSSRIPSVLNRVESITNIVPFKGINPDECVAMGAAIQSGVLDGNIHGLLLLDVTPLSLGIMTTGDNFAKIIERNTTIPIKKSQIFTTSAPYQSNVEVQVFQGEREIASANKLLGKFILKGIRRAPAGVPQIEVTFDIDTNGIVHVSAKDLDTKKMQDITIMSSNNLSDEKINEALADAARYETEDKIRVHNRELETKALITINKIKEKTKTNKELKKKSNKIIKKAYKQINKKLYADLEITVSELEALL